MNRVDSSGPPFDVAIVGGGIIGAGVARDASRRGLRVALIERDDIGSGTTAASTRLVHGGLRYLETADFRLVRLDLRERETLLRIAPHLVTPLAFVLPFFRGHVFDRLRLLAGMFLYDALSFDKSLPVHRVLGASAMEEVEPALDRAKTSGGAMYYDAQVHSPERLALENVLDASDHGTAVMTHTEVVGALHEGNRLCGVTVKDLLTGDESTVRARLVVNASGPWFDAVAGRLDQLRPPLIRTTKGIHVNCDAFTKQAVVLPSAVDGRIVFAIPWSGFTCLGTTDTDFSGDPASASATEADVRYLIESVAPYLPAARRVRRHWTCAGVRALVSAGGAASDVSRMHRVLTEVPGLVSVAGGKITGYRAIAEEVTNELCRQLALSRASSTSTALLPGGGNARSGVPHLDAIYGSRALQVCALADREPSLNTPLSPCYPDVAAQVVFSVRHEWCAGLEDFMFRRSYLGFRPDRGIQAADAASRWMQRELGWPEARRNSEVERYRARVAHSTAHVN